MTPQVKQFLSALLFAVGAALLAFLQKETALLSPDLQVFALSVLVFISHRIPALGTTQAVANSIASGDPASTTAMKIAVKSASALMLLFIVCATAIGCSGAQDKQQAQLAAITAGCKVSLDLDRDAGAAGATDAESEGCAKTLHVWEAQP